MFRDVEELGASSDLFAEIENSLKESAYLVVILSPRYKQSKWCIKEIETFLKYRSRDNILAVIVEGEPYDVFPDVLLENGEPLALDLRADTEKEMLKLAKDRVVRLIASVLGCTYDELFQRHRVARMRRIAMMACVVAIISLVFGAITINQSVQIRQNLLGKQKNQSRYLARISNELLSAGDRDTAMLVALEALPESSTDTSRPYVADARIALENALNTYQLHRMYTLRPMKIMEMDTEGIDKSDYNRDENALVSIDSLGTVYVWDAGSAELINRIDGYAAEDARFAGDGRLLVKAESTVYCIDYTDSNILWQWDYPANDNIYTSFLWDYNPATQSIVCIGEVLQWEDELEYINGEKERRYFITDACRVHIIDAVTGSVTKWRMDDLFAVIPQDPYAYMQLHDVSMSPDGKHIALRSFGGSSLTNADIQHVIAVYPVTGGLAVSSYLSMSDYGYNELYWFDNKKLVSVHRADTSIRYSVTRGRNTWDIECYDIATGRTLWSVNESTISFRNIGDVQSVSVTKNDETINCLGVTVGNVFVCIDRQTGVVYNRIEDRSPIVMAQRLSTGTALLCLTQDGYVFLTDLLEDEVWPDGTNRYTYYLKLDNISRAEYHDNKTYIFSGSCIYWYQPDSDFNYKNIGSGLNEAGYSEDGRYMWLKVNTNRSMTAGSYDLYLYDTIKEEWLGKGDIVWNGRAQIADNRYLVYPSGEAGTVSVYDIEKDKVQHYMVSDFSYDKDTLHSGAVHQSHTVVPVYVDGFHHTYSQEKSEKNALWLKDVSTGEDVISFTVSDIVQGLSKDTEVASFTIYSAYMSADEEYLMIVCNVTEKSENDTRLTEKLAVRVWDMTRGCWQHLPPKAVNKDVDAYSYYKQDGWVMSGTDIICLYGEDEVIRIIDLSDMKILHSLDFGRLGSKEISFTPDGDHIILQDGSYYLKIYNWRKGEYTVDRTIPESARMEFNFYDNGNIMSAKLIKGGMLSETICIYKPDGEGVYRLETQISMCESCNGRTTVISDGNYSRFYSFYTFDDLVEMARKILGDRQLTEAERRTYLID